MDHTTNRDDDKDRSRSEDPQDPAFAWDDMKAGIFERIRAEDPHFFEQRRRRRIPLWLWIGAAALLLGGAAYWCRPGDRPAGGPTLPHRPDPMPASDHRPVATDTRPPGVEIRTTETPPAPPETSARKARGNRPPQVPGTRAGNRPVGEAASRRPENGPAAERKELRRPGTGEPARLASPPIRPVTMRHTPPGAAGPAWQAAPPRLAAGPPATQDGPQAGPQRAPRIITLTGGPSVSGTGYGGSSAAAGLRNGHSTPVSGYRLGLEAWLPLGAGGHLLLGLDRQAHRQYIDISTERPFDTLLQDIVLATTHHIVGNILSDTRGDTLVTAIQKNRLAKYNRFRTVQVQAGYARTVAVGKWFLRPYAGLSAGYLIRQDGWTVAADRSIFPFGNADPILRRLQLKAMAGAQAERPLPGPFSLVLRYQADKAWTNNSLEQDLKWRPATHSFSVGLAWAW